MEINTVQFFHVTLNELTYDLKEIAKKIRPILPNGKLVSVKIIGSEPNSPKTIVEVTAYFPIDVSEESQNEQGYQNSDIFLQPH